MVPTCSRSSLGPCLLLGPARCLPSLVCHLAGFLPKKRGCAWLLLLFESLTHDQKLLLSDVRKRALQQRFRWNEEAVERLEDAHEMLGDEIVCAAVKLLHEQFPSINGLQAPSLQQLIGSGDPSFVRVHGVPAVQIHHAGEQDHWLVSYVGRVTDSDPRPQVFILDTALSTPTEGLKDQLSIMYGHLAGDDNLLSVSYRPVQRQKGGIDCGLFAVAYAYELCAHGVTNVANLVYSQDDLRTHLIQCLVEGTLAPFPRAAQRSKTDVRRMLPGQHQFSIRRPGLVHH